MVENVDRSPSPELLSALGREHVDLVRRVLGANDDLAERAGDLGIRSIYSPQDDTWSTYIGPSAEALTVNVDDHLLLRYDPESLKLIGLEIIELRGYLSQRPEALRLLLNLTRASGARIEPEESSDATLAAVARDVRELVSA